MGKGRSILCALCAAVLALALVLPWAGAAGEIQVYQLAVNETFVDKGELSAGTMPVAVGGTVYVPYTTFDKNATGVDLGISCLQYKDETEHSLTLFNLKGTLIFDINGQTCLANGDYVEMKAIVRNGRTYVPANQVCQFFGLQYSYRPTRSAGILIRIKNSYVALNDEKFINSATAYMQGRYDRYLQSLNAAESPPSQPTPGWTAAPEPVPTDPENPDVRAYLAFRCTAERSDLERIAAILERHQAKALFLFRPEELPERDNAVRRVLSAGHQVGFLTGGSSVEGARSELEKGNDLLAELAWTRSHIAAPEGGGTAAVQEALETDGWRVWSPNYTDNRALRVTALLNGASGRRYTVRLELDDSVSTGDSLERLLRRMEQEEYDLRPVLETELN